MPRRRSKTGFIAALSAITDPADSRARMVITVRADFYAACARIPWLAERITDNQVLVSPMRASEFRRAIIEPARPMGLVLEPGLVNAIVREAVGEAGALPLVAHALVEIVELQGTRGHLDGVLSIGQAGPQIKAFLEK